jgi:hypothetical protein
VRHRPVLARDRVLVASEAREAVLDDETVKRALGFTGSDGEQPRAVVADRRPVHAVEVAPDLVVDVVFQGLVGLRNIKCCLVFRGRLAVFFVIVPSAANGFIVVHEHIKSAALVAVEVLHAEAAAIACPFGEVLAGEREGRRRQHLGDEPSFLSR